jgi:hypothetical protein
MAGLTLDGHILSEIGENTGSATVWNLPLNSAASKCSKPVEFGKELNILF